ncbi:MAG: leucine-rich repeat domain-containing protein [Clostridia bacterium]|nr:leucine-rich repeat domain-containing protein [Clostridia bacterium]
MTSCTDGVLKFEPNKDGSGYAVTGVRDREATEIVIPSAYCGLPVTAINGWELSKCRRLTIPGSITKIVEGLVGTNEELAYIAVDAENPSYCSRDGHLFTKDGAVLVCYAPAAQESSYTIPDGVTRIGGWAFQLSLSLKEIVIPESVAEIGDGAFEWCESLTDITLPECATSIGKDIFRGCTALTSLTLPRYVTNLRESIDDLVWQVGEGIIPLRDLHFGGTVEEWRRQSGYVMADDFAIHCIDGDVLTTAEWYRRHEAEKMLFYAEIEEKTVEKIGNVLPKEDEDGDPEDFDGDFDGSFDDLDFDLDDTYGDEDTDPVEAGAAGGAGDTDPLETDRNDDLDIVVGLPVEVLLELETVADVQKQNVQFKEEEDGRLAVTGLIDPNDEEALIPRRHCGKPVSYIGSFAFLLRRTLRAVTVPHTVEEIRDSAFFGCEALTQLTLPEGLTTIAKDAFFCCKSLETVCLPKSLRFIGRRAFAACTALRELVIPRGVKRIEKEAFKKCTALSRIRYLGTREEWRRIAMGEHCFEGVPCMEIEFLDVGKPKHFKEIYYDLNDDGESYTVTELGTYDDDTVVIPDTYCGKPVTRIGERAFQFLKQYLKSVEIPVGVTIIGEQAFRECGALESVVIPGSVKTVEWGAFFGCRTLSHVVIPEGAEELGQSVFDHCSALQWIELPDTVRSIGAASFLMCDSLTAVTLPNRLKVVEPMLFFACRSLTYVGLPESITKIECEAFAECTSLRTVRYMGTRAAWAEIEKEERCFEGVPATVVHCADGDVPLCNE